MSSMHQALLKQERKELIDAIDRIGLRDFASRVCLSHDAIGRALLGLRLSAASRAMIRQAITAANGPEGLQEAI